VTSIHTNKHHAKLENTRSVFIIFVIIIKIIIKLESLFCSNIEPRAVQWFRRTVTSLSKTWVSARCSPCGICGGPTVHPTDDMSMENRGGLILTGENRRTGRKPVPVPLCPPQIQHGLTRSRTLASAVRKQQLTS
jgi:hypothetical protein